MGRENDRLRPDRTARYRRDSRDSDCQHDGGERDHRQHGEFCRAALRRPVERVDRDRKGRLRPRLPISNPYFKRPVGECRR